MYTLEKSNSNKLPLIKEKIGQKTFRGRYFEMNLRR